MTFTCTSLSGRQWKWNSSLQRDITSKPPVCDDQHACDHRVPPHHSDAPEQNSHNRPSYSRDIGLPRSSKNSYMGTTFNPILTLSPSPHPWYTCKKSQSLSQVYFTSPLQIQTHNLHTGKQYKTQHQQS